MTKQEVIDLIQKYQDGECSAEERAKLESWYIEHSRNEPDMPFPEDLWARKEAGLQQIFGEQTTKKNTFSLYIKYTWAAAAAILMTIGIATWYFNANRTGLSAGNSLANNKIVPGKNMATITLANGKIINLSDTKTGIIIAADKVIYNDGTEISDPALAEAISLKAGENTMITANTPNGGTYQITLMDGSKIWLNAASSLKFPSNFTDETERSVEMSGEIYFEVSKDERHPFVVRNRGQEVTVLGTHFNVNAYGDEDNIKTTLLEGSVRVEPLSDQAANKPERKKLEGIILKPNQQSTISGSGQIDVKEVDVEAIVGWKNGDFAFNGEDFRSTMRKIGRWYNVEVEYDASAATDISLDLDGWVSRKSSLSDVLKRIESAGNVHFKIEGRKVIVTK